MPFIELKDFFLLPVYLIIIYIIAYSSRHRQYGFRHPLYKYYIPALTVKIIGSVGIGLVYQYYYGIAGDTGNYFINARMVTGVLNDSLIDFLELVFKPISSTLSLRNKIPWTDYGFGYSESNNFPVRILAILELLTFKTYLPTAILFAFLTFQGIWKAYTAFVHMFPALYKEFAIAFLFMPSVFFWGSGILKDALIMGALGWLFYSSYTFFILRIKIVTSAIILFCSISVIVIVKPYVALAFLPSLLFWIFFQYRSRIQSYYLRAVALPVIIFMVVIGAIFIINAIGTQDEKYSADNLVNQASSFNANNMEAGSSVDLGVTPGMGPGKLLKIAPLAILTTLFRPFIFEVRNPLMLLSALEGIYLMYLLGLTLYKTGLTEFFRMIVLNPLVSFCLVFSLVFAFAIGFSTSNFGTLVRYKIPCIPFFIAALYIIRYQALQTRNLNRRQLKQIQKTALN